MNGILNIDKPAGISSAAVVGRVKRLLPKGTKVGHAGTLDPFATGVLILLIGKATKQCESLMNQPKGYETTVKFGATTETDDLASPEIPWPVEVKPVTIEQIRATLPRFIGEISQRPPDYSALKIGGEPAYKRKRRGESVPVQARTVRVDAIELIDFTWPLLKLKIDCGRGTYIRSIARDLGEALNVGGYLTQLRRTRVGEFRVENALKLDSLTADGVVAQLSRE